MISLYHGDEVVATTVYRDGIVVATKRGHLYWLVMDERTRAFIVQEIK